MVRLVYRAEVFQEDDRWVSLCSDLDVSSFGDTPDQAKDCIEIRSLQDVLIESGFVRHGEAWRIRQRTTDELEATVA